MSTDALSLDPRAEMARRLPRWTQPLLSAITAAPLPGEAYRPRAGHAPLVAALCRLVPGVGLAAAALHLEGAVALAAYALGAILAVSGLGLVQVVVFHYCAHGGVLGGPRADLLLGRAISVVFAFKHFDAYKREHIQHHRAQKLITEEDEFATFVVGVCGLKPGMSRRALRARLAWTLVSPAFHLRFLGLRLKGNLACGDAGHAALFAGYWAALVAGALALGLGLELALAWLVPLVLFLQAATVFRILIEHRFPDAALLRERGKRIIAEATTGVFAGRIPPAAPAGTPGGLAAWALWWADLLTVQLFVRLVVLVGDAAAHDFHHRRPGARNWPDALHARAADKAAGCPGYPVNYIDVWGLGRAVAQNLAALAAADAAALRGPAAPAPAVSPAPRLAMQAG